MTRLDPASVTGRDVFEHMVALRRELHRHPELSWQEHETAGRLVAALDTLGLTSRRGVAGTGVIAEIPGAAGPAVALRADMDALPVREETGLEYASRTEGVMHACGHDAHMAMLVGAAELLVREQELPAPVRLVFQPAEETGLGAPAMIEAGALDGVGMIFGGHVDRAYGPGEVMLTDGTVNASTDSFRIELSGPGGHAARPQETVDLVAVAADLVGKLTTLVPRILGSREAGVVTVAQFHAGSVTNVIPTATTLAGTIRALTSEARESLCAAVKSDASSAAHGSGAGVRVMISPGTPPVVNESQVVKVAQAGISDVPGLTPVSPTEQNMGGEDFGFYLERVPGCFVRLGARPVGTSHPAHSSRFVIDERVLAAGAAYYRSVAAAAGRALAART